MSGDSSRPKSLADTKAVQNFLAKQAATEDLKAEMESAYRDFLEDCRYPVDKAGNVMDSGPMVWIVAYHMVRCGWRRAAAPVIKPRPVDAPGVLADAIEWVGVDEPDDPLQNLEQMTVAEIGRLPEHLRRAAIRRLGGNADADDDLPEIGEPAWQVTPNITVRTAAPDCGGDFIPKANGGKE